MHSYELNLDQLSKQHRQQAEKMCASQTNDKKNLQKKMRSDQVNKHDNAGYANNSFGQPNGQKREYEL